MSEWAHLPNARHIDWVIESVRAQPDAWAAARAVTWDAGWYAALRAARDATRDATRSVITDATWDVGWSAECYAALRAAKDVTKGATWIATRDTVGGAVGALVAFDYAGDILDMPVPAVRLLAASGDPAAVLLLPAVIVRHGDTDE